MKQNHWIAEHNANHAAWIIGLPTDTSPRLDMIIEFIEFLLKIGQETQAYYLDGVNDGDNFLQFNDEHTFAHYVRDLAAKTGEIRCFDIPTCNYGVYAEGLSAPIFTNGLSGAHPIGEGVGLARFINAKSKLSFFRDDSVAEETIDNMGELMVQLHPPEVVKNYVHLMANVPPIIIKGETVPSDGHELAFWGFTDEADASDLQELLKTQMSIYIRLATTIWFPELYTITNPVKLANNRELAQRHTPRLNSFLKHLRDYVLAIGGSWRHSASNFYKNMVDENGIKL